MRILFLTHLYLPTIGGVQRSVYNLASKLVDRGHDVSIATHRGGVSVEHDDRLPVLGLNVPSPFTFNPLKAAQRYALDAVNVAALLAWCRSRRVQLVHGHLINVDTRYASIVGRVTGARTVVTLRGGETEHWLDTYAGRTPYVRRVLESADRVTAVSASLLSGATDLAPSVASKSTVVPNPALPQAIVAAAGRGPQPARPYVVFVGRLEDMKDVATLVDAYHLAWGESGLSHDLIIVGDGSLRGDLERRAHAGPAGEHVTFRDGCGHAESLGLIRDAELLVLPSRSSEGCPNVVLEAMALATPVVVSDLEALRELVDGGGAGAVFPRGDAPALARTLVTLLEDAARRDHYIRAGRERLAARHRFEPIIEAYEGIYHELITSSRSRARSPS